MMSIEIKELCQVPDYSPILAFWSYMEWYRDRPIGFDLVLMSYKIRAEDNSMPVSFVAVKDSLPVGMISLKMDDLWSRKDINPWLASLFVLPGYRNIGIGDLLVSSVINRARDLDIKRLYLFLGQSEMDRLEEFYLKRGWKFFEKSKDNDGVDTKIFFTIP